jgi:NADH-quinone oxidoreductase subunit K
MMDIRFFLSLAAVMFTLGAYGVLTRRNAVGILLSIELMANAVNLNLVAFGHYGAGASGQVFALFGIALTVTEVIVGLAIVVLLHRGRRDIAVDLANEMSR